MVDRFLSKDVWKMSSLSFTGSSDGVIVAGKTYAVKDVLKAVGGRWTPQVNGWVFAERSVEAVKEALADVVTKKRSVARAQKVTPEEKRAKVIAARAAGTHTWICCDQCDVLDWTRKTSDCPIHEFRLRGCRWTGT